MSHSLKPIAALLAAMIPLAASAAEPADTRFWVDHGFSYFIGLAQQHTRYREQVSGEPIESRVSTRSPLLVSGALYAVNADLLLALDNETTFAPSTRTETWNATGPVVDGVTLTSSQLQQNKFRLSDTTTRLLVHQRVADQTYLIGGAAFHSQSFRRYSFASGPDNLVKIVDGQTTEESAGEVLLQLGAALESAAVRNVGSHYSLRATLGVPVWRRVENTIVPDVQFNGTGGLDLAVEGRYSIALTSGVHIGGWARLSQSRRSAQTESGVELPRSRTDQTAYGIELLWKL